jgi:cytochrome c6
MLMQHKSSESRDSRRDPATGRARTPGGNAARVGKPQWAACQAKRLTSGCGTDEQKNMRMKKLLTLLIAILSVGALSAKAADAKALYEENCQKCHGADGKGETKMGKKMGAKDYTDAKVQAELKDDAATKAIKEGLKDKEGKVIMKPAESLSDGDIKGLVAYMRGFKK